MGRNWVRSVEVRWALGFAVRLCWSCHAFGQKNLAPGMRSVSFLEETSPSFIVTILNTLEGRLLWGVRIAQVGVTPQFCGSSQGSSTRTRWHKVKILFGRALWSRAACESNCHRAVVLVDSTRPRPHPCPKVPPWSCDTQMIVMHWWDDVTTPVRDGWLRSSDADQRPKLLQLKDLLRTADAGEDYSMDRALQEACQSVVDVACKFVKPGEARSVVPALSCVDLVLPL